MSNGMSRVSMAAGVANLSRVRKLQRLGSLGPTEFSQALIYLQAAAESLLRLYLTMAKGIPSATRNRASHVREMSFPELVEDMARYAHPPLNIKEELLRLNSLRIEAAHPRETPLAVDAAYLETALATVESLYETYADSIESDWRDAMGSPTELMWVEIQPKGFKFYPSTTERRVVWLKHGSPMQVLPPGHHYPRVLSGVDQVAFVTMVPRRLKAELSQKVLSRDRVPITGEAALDVVIKDDDSAIRRLVLNATDQERLLMDTFTASVNAEIAQHSYTELLSDQDSLNRQIASRMALKLEVNDSVFRVIDVFVLRLEAADANLAATALERAHAAERASTELTLLAHKREQQRQEAELEKEKIQYQRIAEHERLQQEIDLAEKRREIARLELELTAIKEEKQQNLDLLRAKLERDIRIEQIMAQAALGEHLDSERGKLAFYPEKVFEIKKLELENEKYRLEKTHELIKEDIRSRASFKGGQASALLEVLAKREHITLEQGPAALPETSAGTPTDSSEDTQAAEIAYLSKIFPVRRAGNTVAISVADQEIIEIELNLGGGAPVVWRILNGEKSKVDMPWWSPGMTLAETLGQCRKPREA